jgi:hypothetical protein
MSNRYSLVYIWLIIDLLTIFIELRYGANAGGENTQNLGGGFGTSS